MMAISITTLVAQNIFRAGVAFALMDYYQDSGQGNWREHVMLNLRDGHKIAWPSDRSAQDRIYRFCQEARLAPELQEHFLREVFV